MVAETKLIFGCGYLGRRVAAAWVSQGATVHAVTRSPERAASWRKEGLQPLIADVCEPATLTALPEVDTVLYAVGFDRSSGRSQREVAVEGLRHVLERVACRRFLFISSSSVYGQSAGEWVDETSPCVPTQPGGECALAAEGLVGKASSSGGATVTESSTWPCRTTLDTATSPSVRDRGTHDSILSAPSSIGANVLRLSGIYGPQRLLSKVDALRAGMPLSGQAEAWLNLIHVDDAVQAVLACEARGQPGETYLVSDDRPVPRGEYYAHLAKLVDAPPPTFDESQPSQRGSGGLNKRCRNRKLRAELGVTLQYPTFVEGLAASIR